MASLFVQVNRVKIPTLDAGTFGANQGSAVFEILGAMLRPEVELPIVSGNSFKMLSLLLR